MNIYALAQMPGYRMAEYQVILNPHEDLRNRIMNIKKEFSEKYNLPLYSGKPHITLLKFKVWELMEEKLVNHLKIIAMGLPPVKIHLKDYNHFPTHTIYINVESKLVLENLSGQLKQARRLMRSLDNEPHFIKDPFIPIAQKIPAEIYQKASIEYKHRHFTASFIADRMLLLKRREGDYGFQILQSLQFMNLPVSIKQGDLF